MPKFITKKEAIELLMLPEKHFENYYSKSKEIKAYKLNGRFHFNQDEIIEWHRAKNERTVMLSLNEYKQCFEFALKMAYSSGASHGTGIRGVRSEPQQADDYILGILAEFGVQKLLLSRFNTEIYLDMEVHPDHITPQDFYRIKKDGTLLEPKIGVAVKSSKLKSCFNVIPPIEYENNGRLSDVYIFVRVGLPSDHLFRLFVNHEWIKNVNLYFKELKGHDKIEPIKEIPIWVTGFNFHNEFRRVTEIPGQKFSGNPDYRYAVSVSEMHNSDKDWVTLLSQL